MSYTWPAEIPLPSNSYSALVVANVTTDSTANGPLASRVKNNVITRKYNLLWRLTDAERTLWINAYESASNGNQWVYMVLPLRDGNELHRVRFSRSSYQEVFSSFFNWEISADVEINDLQMLTSDEIDSLVDWTDFVYPSELAAPDNIIPTSQSSGQTRIAFDNTITRQRQRFSRLFKQWEFTFHLSTEDRYLWESIYQNKLNSGTTPITINVPNNGTLEATEVRYSNEYNIAYVMPDLWRISVLADEDISTPITPEIIIRS